jgi:hypothetical protein
MPEVQEVFHMSTQKVRPDPNALERQLHKQKQRSATQKAAVFVLIGALVIGGAVFGLGALRSDEARRDRVRTDPTSSPLPTVGDGFPLEPGRYVLSTTDPEFDSSHQITIDVPGDYFGWEGAAVFKDGLDETGVVAMVAGSIFADACGWRGTRSAISSADDLVTTPAGQHALRPSSPRDDTVAGLDATRMMLRTPSVAKVSRCDGNHFMVSGGPDGEAQRYLDNPGQDDYLWILDVDGQVLVIDAPVGLDASAQDRAEVLQIVESIRIDPR